MIYYLSFFLLFFLFSKLNVKSEKLKKKVWLFSFLFLFLILGSRYYIGGDYFGYMHLYNKMDSAKLTFPLFNLEFIYYSILFISNKLDLGYFFVNFFLMFIFLYFFEKYIKNFPNPYYVLLISIPILLIPISINFVRQAIAISIFLFSIRFLIRGNYLKYFFYVFIASMFHKFALIYLIFYFFYEKNKNKLRMYVYFLLIFLFLFGFLSEIIQIPVFKYWMNRIIWQISFYTDQTYPLMPKGLYFRLSLMIISFLILIYFKKFFQLNKEYKIWFCTGIISIMLIPITIFFPLLASRIIVFFLPIIIFVFGNIILQNEYRKIFNINLLSLFFLIYFFVWLNFSPFKNFFTPYKSIFFL